MTNKEKLRLNNAILAIGFTISLVTNLLLIIFK